MDRREPEQLNMPDVPEEYDLEDILREFGSGGTKPLSDTQVFQPLRGDPPDKPKGAPTETARFPAVKPADLPPREPAGEPPEEPEEPPEEPAAEKPPKEKKRARRAKPPTPPMQERGDGAPIRAVRERTAREPVPERVPREPVPERATREPKPERATREPKPERATREPKPERATREPKPERAAREPREPVIRPVPKPPVVTPQELLGKCRAGLGGQRIRLWAASLVALAQLFLLVYRAVPWSFLPVLSSHGGAVGLILALCSVLLSYDVLFSGLRDLFRLQIGMNTLGAVAALLTFVHAFVVRPDGGGYCPVLSLLLMFLLRADSMRRSGTFFTLRAVCGFDAPMGIFSAPQFPEKAAPLRRGRANTQEYLQRLSDADLPQKVFRVYASALLPLSAAAAYFLRGEVGFLSAWLLLLLGALPFSAALCFARPYAALAKRLSRFGGALCGWHSARIFGGKHTVILRDGDLFPPGSVSFNGMKIYGAYSGERVLGYALAALDAAENPLTGVFEEQLQIMHGKHYRATAFRFYDNDGIGAEILGEPVLVGSLDFIRSMGVHMPEGTRVRQAVYVSVSGELAGVFAIKYKPNASTRAGLRDILANRSFSVVLATRDFLVSPELLAARYELATDALVFPAFPERVRLSDRSEGEQAEQGALIAKNTFGAFASTVAAGHTLRTASVLSMGLSLFSGLFGAAVCALLLLWNAAAVASPLHLAAFQLLWACLNGFISLLLQR